MQKELETAKAESVNKVNSLEKENALLKQESHFKDKEADRISSQLEKTLMQLSKAQAEHASTN